MTKHRLGDAPATKRVLLLGLDGMTYSVLEPAFEAGHMPVFQRLLERGASGVLTSTVPPYTPPGWTSIFTGVNPGKHGIFGFTLGNVQSSKGLVSLDRVTAPRSGTRRPRRACGWGCSTSR